MSTSQFKNDNRANPEAVIDHMLTEAEEQIRKMTGKKVKLMVRHMDN